MLPLNTFIIVIASTLLISIDLIVRNDEQEILIGERLNRPAKGCRFAPGGRVLKDEALEVAFKRLMNTGLGIDVGGAEFKGVFQRFYTDNMFGCDFGTYYVVLASEISDNCVLSVLPKEQHGRYKWFSERELLQHESVHRFTKQYFQVGLNADASIIMNRLKDKT